MKPHLQPVRDPIRTLVWYASAADIDTVIIDGKPVVRGGRATSVDEAAIVTAGRDATLRSCGRRRSAAATSRSRQRLRRLEVT